jgi:hypothetical protein
MGVFDWFRAPKQNIAAMANPQTRPQTGAGQYGHFQVAAPSTFPAYRSTPNYRDVVPGFRTGTSATERGKPGRPVMRNVPAATTGVSLATGQYHQKYASAPIPGGNVLQYDYTPYQLQARPNYQERQYGYPRPGIDLRPPDATYGSAGFDEGTIHTRLEAPFAVNNLPKNIAPRPSELLQDFGRPNYRQPLSYYMAQKTPVGMNPEMQFAHKLTAGLTPYAPARDYPPSTVGWTTRGWFWDRGAVPGVDHPHAPAQLERTPVKMSAPPQLQTSPGGLTIAAYANVQRNLNIDLAHLYRGATAPVAQAYSAMCQ